MKICLIPSKITGAGFSVYQTSRYIELLFSGSFSEKLMLCIQIPLKRGLLNTTLFDKFRQ
jgi:hypothetical protein